MDAHLFRRFCEELLPRLIGARMEKIHALGAGVLVFCLFGGQAGDRKRYLVLRAGRQHPFLFATKHSIPSNAQPPAHVMLLRKHLSGRRISHAVCHWTERRLWLCFSGVPEVWLLLDLRDGACLSFSPPQEFQEPCWPDAGRLTTDEWRNWSVLTPALRRTLAFLEPADAAALLVDLQMGGGNVFLYEKDDFLQISAWPIPPAQAGSGWKESVFANPLAAMEQAGEKLVFQAVAEKARQTAEKPFCAEILRLDRLLKKLDAEELRLKTMLGRQKDALLLQSKLYLFDKNAKTEFVQLECGQGQVTLHLDPKRTIGENMAELFHQAGRGKRGLKYLAARRASVLQEKKQAEQERDRSLAAAACAPAPALTRERQVRRVQSVLPAQIQTFQSSDGFLILRGRSSKGNLLLLKLASPYDFWLHTAEGSSAHAVIRRDHAGQHVPERTLAEAGILTALKSWQKDQQHAEIQYSLAKFIHPMKNTAAGTVRIDRSEGSFQVDIDPDLEDRLEKR